MTIRFLTTLLQSKQDEIEKVPSSPHPITVSLPLQKKGQDGIKGGVKHIEERPYNEDKENVVNQVV